MTKADIEQLLAYLTKSCRGEECSESDNVYVQRAAVGYQAHATDFREEERGLYWRAVLQSLTEFIAKAH